MARADLVDLRETAALLHAAARRIDDAREYLAALLGTGNRAEVDAVRAKVTWMNEGIAAALARAEGLPSLAADNADRIADLHARAVAAGDADLAAELYATFMTYRAAVGQLSIAIKDLGEAWRFFDPEFTRWYQATTRSISDADRGILEAIRDAIDRIGEGIGGGAGIALPLTGIALVGAGLLLAWRFLSPRRR